VRAETQLKLMAVKVRELEEEKMAEQRRLIEVVEDQAETIRKLKAGLAERDELGRREGALRTQKGLEKQMAGEMDCANEPRVRLDKVNMSYAELSTHWKVKRELISDLDSKVHKTKVDYKARMAALKDESERLRREAECLDSKVHKTKVDYEARMAALKDEGERLMREAEYLDKRLRKVDNFSQQYGVSICSISSTEREHLKITTRPG